MAAESGDTQLAELGGALLSRADELSDTMLALMRRDVSFHRTVTLVSDDQLRATVRTHLDFILGAFGPPQLNYDTRAAAATGRSRAAVGVPLPAVMDSYRICARFLWDELKAESARRPAVTAVGLLRASEAMWKVLEEFTTAMVTGYQEEIAHQMVNRQQERSAMVQALIDGRLTDTVDLWNTADTLRISLRGPYVVVCAELARISRTGFPDVEERLSVRGIFSAWRLQPGISIGVLHPGPSTGMDPVLEGLAQYPVTRVGISPLFDDLAGTAGALRYARIAMTAARPDRAPITVFDRDVMAVAAAGAPEGMGRTAAHVVGPLNDLPDQGSEARVATLAALFRHGGP